VTKQWIAVLAAVGCQLGAIAPAVAQDAVGPPKPATSSSRPATQTVPGPSEPMEEVEIIGQRALRELREEMIRVEDKFYKRYNELNTKDEYDVHCNMEKVTGTLISTRVCRPEFVSDATSEEAKGFLGGYTVAPANMVIMAKYPEFEREALSVINKNRDLRVLIRERETLEARYENVRRQQFGERASEEKPQASPAAATPAGK
jgi:hypothetical protein